MPWRNRPKNNKVIDLDTIANSYRLEIWGIVNKQKRAMQSAAPSYIVVAFGFRRDMRSAWFSSVLHINVR